MRTGEGDTEKQSNAKRCRLVDVIYGGSVEASVNICFSQETVSSYQP